MNYPESLPITFGFSPKYRLSVYASTVLFFAVAGGAIYAGIIDTVSPNPNAVYVIGIAVLIMSLGLYQIRIAPRLRDTITVSESHITQQFANGSSVSMQWDEISVIQARNFLGRIELVSKDSDKTIFIEYQLKDFSKLVAIIQYYTSNKESK